MCVRPRPRFLCALTVLLFAANPLLVTGLHAQSPSTDWNGAAKLMSFSGQVSVLRDGDPWA